MKIRNKRNGTNTLAYKVGGVTKSEIITSGSVVDLKDLVEFNQIVNKHDFTIRGWFEIIEESKEKVVLESASAEENKETLDSTLEKAKKEAVKYSADKTKKSKNKNK